MKKNGKLLLGKLSYIFIGIISILLFLLIIFFGYSLFGRKGTYSFNNNVVTCPAGTRSGTTTCICNLLNNAKNIACRNTLLANGFNCMDDKGMTGRDYTYRCTIIGGTQSSYWVKFFYEKPTISTSIYKQVTVKSGGTVPQPSNPTHPSSPTLKFSYWAKVTDNSKYTFGTAVKADTGLYAVWVEKKNYKVTFDSNGGSAVAAKNVVEGNKVTAPTNPTRNGWTFVEWQLDGKTYDFSKAVTSNIILKASWRLNSGAGCYYCDTTQYPNQFLWAYNIPASGCYKETNETKCNGKNNVCWECYNELGYGVSEYKWQNIKTANCILTNLKQSNCQKTSSSSSNPTPSNPGSSSGGSSSGNGETSSSSGDNSSLPTSDDVEAYSDIVNGDRCYNGDLVTVLTCQSSEKNSAPNCKLKDGSIVARSLIKYVGACTTTASFSDEINGDRCYLGIGTWVRVVGCQPGSVTGSLCKLKDGTLVSRKNISNGNGCAAITTNYTDTIDDYRCNKDTGNWVHVSSCQPYVLGAKCKTDDGTIFRSSLTNKFGCEPLPAKYTDVINDYKCNKETGDWVYISSCQPKDVGAQCKATDDTVLRSILTNGSGCKIEVTEYTEVVDDYMYNNDTKEWVYISSCQLGDNGAQCDTKDGIVFRSSLVKDEQSEVTESNSSNTYNGDNNINNPQTGTVKMFIAFFIGMIALIISGYYFKKNGIFNI